MLTGTRLKMQQLMEATLADERAHADWTYRAVRPMPVPPTWHPGQKVVGDCSKGVQYICRWANAPDPMRNGWSTIGNSQTIWLTLPHVATAGQLEVGDIVTFGVNARDHAALVMEAGTDPLLWSFGHSGAPNAYRLSFDRREHQFCALPVVAPKPTPADRLRAETGFYSWVAWKLGEGPWRTYGPAKGHVRPDVPALIPAQWWKWYAQFLLNRKKALL
jgi:hypothetical protein